MTRLPASDAPSPSRTCGPVPALSRQGRGAKRSPPRWVIAFLRALERTGEVRLAAEDAGVDYSTAYARRRAHPEFAAEWAAAKERFLVAKDEARGEEMAGKVEALRKAPPPPAGWSPSPDNAGEETVISNGKLRRAGPGRWSSAKEQALLAELAWSGGIRRACNAAGISTESLSKRRLKDRHLDAACNAAIEIARARLNGMVVEAGNRTFDPDELPVGEEHGPEVTVAEAIQILKLGAGRGSADAQPACEEPHDIEAVRERIEQVMRSLGLIEDPEHKLAAGWQLADGHWIPPGWVRAEEARGGS